MLPYVIQMFVPSNKLTEKKVTIQIVGILCKQHVSNTGWRKPYCIVSSTHDNHMTHCTCIHVVITTKQQKHEYPVNVTYIMAQHCHITPTGEARSRAYLCCNLKGSASARSAALTKSPHLWDPHHISLASLDCQCHPRCCLASHQYVQGLPPHLQMRQGLLPSPFSIATSGWPMSLTPW